VTPADRAAAERAEQQLDPTITDAAALDAVAVLLSSPLELAA